MEQIVNVINASFLSDLLSDDSVSDITYNGQELFIYSANKGRMFVRNIAQEEVMKFLRNIANLANAKFSYSDVFLDISAGKYRLSAMHPARSRYDYKEAPSFALRINHDFLKNHPHYIAAPIEQILKTLLKEQKTIIISGKTGVGKTTLQKHLLTKLADATRLIVIDNVMELGEVRSLNKMLDITLWQMQNANENEVKQYVKNALRFHPDYIIIAESRGEEINEIYQSIITGHPNIITLHASTTEAVYLRLTRLIKSATNQDIYRAFPVVIHLEKKENQNRVIRYIKEIIRYDEATSEFIKLYEER